VCSICVSCARSSRDRAELGSVLGRRAFAVDLVRELQTSSGRGHETWAVGWASTSQRGRVIAYLDHVGRCSSHLFEISPLVLRRGVPIGWRVVVRTLELGRAFAGDLVRELGCAFAGDLVRELGRAIASSPWSWSPATSPRCSGSAARLGRRWLRSLQSRSRGAGRQARLPRRLCAWVRSSAAVAVARCWSAGEVRWRTRRGRRQRGGRRGRARPGARR